MKTMLRFLAALLFTANAFAVDGIFLAVGNGQTTNMARVGATWNFDKTWFNEGNWLVTGYWEADIGSWRGNSAIGNNQTITEIGLTPVFRFQQKSPTGFAPYLEGAIGVHFISPTFIYANRKFGSSFQFGDHVGVGVRFGDKQQFDLAYRFQHLSNGSYRAPNQGINFNQLHFSYHF